jgi:hypothetical protein
MRFFRSEEALHEWEATASNRGGESLTLPQLWALSKRWYHNRLSPSYHGRMLAEIEDIFRSVGLTSPFWRASAS